MKYLLTLLCLSSLAASAQDVLPAQFRAALLLYNPANAGLMKEDVRVAMVYQNQWAQRSANPFTWSYASIDMNLLKGKLPKGDALGLGISGKTWRYEETYNYLKRTDKIGTLTLAYHKGIGKKKVHHISAGIQTSLVNKVIDATHSTNLPGSSDALNYPDYGMGIAYSGAVSRRSSVYCGYSLYHPFQPVEVYFGTDSARVLRRQTALAGWNFLISRRFSLRTNALLNSQAGSQQLSVGTSAAVSVNPSGKHPATLQLGGWWYSTEALVPYFAAEWYNLRLGASYGYHTNQFTQAILPAASFEISLVYTGMFRKATEYWNVPRL
ncbi:MAG: PorP/SprF family type IX secretion system membrane protein [Taibaiella sp.]|nr:PorP/SprF family type IX secretion system membrane protein [Taibaiella sp.]